ncbi:winged helix-turn-helix transcriptional regulator [Phormidium tenue FACHB-886]|nr:winged helix-turn-helix transcriptional regulator [Phormidium tenue FACHB-886]
MSNAEYHCPVEVTLEVISGRWKCVILWWLRRDAKRFGELKSLIPKITQKVLTQQLRELEEDGLIHREAYREAPPRVEYSLTAYGETLRPITELLCDWGKTHMPQYQFGALRLEGLQILVVCSDLAVRDRLQMVIEARAAQVIAVADITTAAATVQQTPLSVLVVDINSLGDEAYTLIHQVKRFETEQEIQIPAIALTSNEFERSTARREFQIYLSEPFEPIELIAVIASLAQRLD